MIGRGYPGLTIGNAICEVSNFTHLQNGSKEGVFIRLDLAYMCDTLETREKVLEINSDVSKYP
eukprot:IDg5069t1